MSNLFDEIRIGDVRQLTEEDGWEALSTVPRIAAIVWAKTVCFEQHNRRVQHFTRNTLYYLYGSVEHYPHQRLQWPVNHYLVAHVTYSDAVAILYRGDDDWQIITLSRPGLEQRTYYQLLIKSAQKDRSTMPAPESKPTD